MGTLNALYLIVAPLGTFLGSTLIAVLRIDTTCLVLGGMWVVVAAAALLSPTLRDLGDRKRASGVQMEQDADAA